MADLYVFDPGGDPDERARRENERVERRARVRARYARRIVERVGVDEITADLTLAVLFDHSDADGRECMRGNHPQLPDDGEWSRDAGFDCPCTWDAARREREEEAHAAAWDEWTTGPAAEAERRAEEAEAAEIATWLLTEPGVAAARTVLAYPEVWEGTVDGHSFYFRERGGSWRIEIDLEPNGRFANRFVGTTSDGELQTEPVELTSGPVIAQGTDSELGTTSVEHLSFVVRTIRDYLRRAECAHAAAARFCPDCGERVAP